MLNYTRFGRHVLAVGGNEEATRLMGLPVARIKLSVYAINGGLAALAGVILVALSSNNRFCGAGGSVAGKAHHRSARFCLCGCAAGKARRTPAFSLVERARPVSTSVSA